ncbi:DUF4144 family protein [Pseudoalteromonas fenneropenaei]|uniref:DUF4144 family protein n=1 Tax=Pseudoalteromonas fenneropenaei TaxID=1737459 RepID=A0ABV7CKW2_9GAMM
MRIKSYPMLLLVAETLVYIDSEESLNDELHSLSEQSLSESYGIYQDASCLSLQGHALTLPSLTDLSQLVQQSLLREGHCCVSKIQLRSVNEAFALLAAEQSPQMCRNTAS